MLKIGTSGFSFPDWYDTVYPKGLPKERMLEFYQKELGFDCVEINATYYHLVSDRMFIGMLKKTGPGFEFVVKAFQGITHNPFDTRLGEKKPSLNQAEEDTKKFLYSIQPLKKENRLGGVLLQYPVFFNNTPVNQDYILKCQAWLDNVPIIVEFRNQGWAKDEIFDFLRKHQIGYCVVDEPKLPRLMPFVNVATSDIGYLRFHGRNPHWFNAPMAERYNYLYNDKELQEFIPEINKLSQATAKTFLFFNNCHMGFAVKNGLRLKEFLKG